MSRPAALQRDDDGEVDERGGTGWGHRAKQLKGWGKHLHGYACPRCGVTCHDRVMKVRHDSDHATRDEYDEEWQELVESLEERIRVLEAQHAFIAETLGPLLADAVKEREPA